MSARVPRRESPPCPCAVEGGALPLGLEQVNCEMSYKAPIVSQLSRSQRPPSARGGLFVCSSSKCSLGSRQIKSQLAHLGHGGQCGMCSLASSAPWQAALAGRQLSLAGCSPRSGLGGRRGGAGPVAHTQPRQKHRWYLGRSPSPNQDSHATGASGLDLTQEHLFCPRNGLC